LSGFLFNIGFFSRNEAHSPNAGGLARTDKEVRRGSPNEKPVVVFIFFVVGPEVVGAFLRFWSELR